MMFGKRVRKALDTPQNMNMPNGDGPLDTPLNTTEKSSTSESSSETKE